MKVDAVPIAALVSKDAAASLRVAAVSARRRCTGAAQTRSPVDLAELTSLLRNDGHWSGELRHSCKDGSEVIVDSRMQLVGGGAVLEVNRDITETRALASRQAALMRELTDTAAKFEVLFNQSGRG